MLGCLQVANEQESVIRKVQFSNVFICRYSRQTNINLAKYNEKKLFILVPMKYNNNN